jgi:nucleotide-binding universal stress UspA family protein
MKTILCAIDFSEFAQAVLTCAAVMAHRMKAELILFHAVNFPQDGLYSTDALERPAREKELERRAAKAMTRLMAPFDVSWRAEIAVGEPVDRIIRTARDTDADLVVTASHGLSGVQRILLGTVVEKLARHLLIPLVVVHPSFDPATPWSPDLLLVGCGLHSPTEPAVGWALTLARPLNARLHLLHAMASPMDARLVEPTEAPYGQVQDRLVNHQRQRLKSLLPLGCQASLSLVPGPPGEALRDQVRDRQSTLLVVGAEPRSRLDKFLIGSTTEWLLRHAPCPVLVVPTAKP